MRLLIVAATVLEIDPFLKHLDGNFEKENSIYRRDGLEVFICITGIGSMFTAFALSEAFTDFDPDFAIQAGVAGTYSPQLSYADLVVVESEILGDLGAENHEEILDLFELDLMKQDYCFFNRGRLVNPLKWWDNNLNLPLVKGLTVNLTAGSMLTIEKRRKKYNCDIESMEGAAFHYICLKNEIPFLQIRSISNDIEPRDKSKWRMKEAIVSLNGWLIKNFTVVTDASRFN